jgi:UTP--glucose-1-phosphate uridylyltransferase
MQDPGHSPASRTVRPPVTAVVPAAGLGTRLRPLSDAIPKEMLPVGRRLVLERIVVELEAAGIRHIVLVVSPAKQERFRAHFGARSGGVEFTYIVQPEMRGLGDAVLRAGPIVEDTFIVALGDAVFEEPTPGAVTRRLIDAAAASEAAVGLVVHRVAPENLSRYGVVRPMTSLVADGGAVIAISDIVEKPAAHEAPSDLAAAARYVVTHEVFEALRATPADARGELQLTHALQRLLRQGCGGVAVPLQTGERRHDIGAFDSYFRAFLAFALADEEYGDALRRELAAGREGVSQQEGAEQASKQFIS